MTFTPDLEQFCSLMDAVDAFKDYLETQDDYEEGVLIDLHGKITENLINLVCNQETQDIDACERIRRETEHYLSTTVEFDAFTEEGVAPCES